MWNGRGPRCFLLQNKEVLQRVLLQKLFLQLEKSQHTGQTSGISHLNKLLKRISNVFYLNGSCIKLCVVRLTKGKPPTKKAKVLQKQPLMAKLAAYAQYQSNQQSPAKSKSGIMMKSINCLLLFFFCLFVFLSSERDLYIMYYIVYLSILIAIPVEGFDWGQYICSNNMMGAPVSCFKHVRIAHKQLFIQFKIIKMVSISSTHACVHCVLQVAMRVFWGDITDGVRVEVLNSDTNLSTKVYWIAEIIKLAGKFLTSIYVLLLHCSSCVMA